MLAALLLPLHTQAQNWTWAENAGGTLPDEANGCTMDANGNLFATGFFFSSSINFGNGNSMSNSTAISEGFVVKYSAAGSTQWASRIKGTREDKATRCATDPTGNVIVTGYFDSPSLQFGGNNNHSISNFDNSGNTFDCFIVKYSASGTPLWFHSIGREDDDGGSAVATDINGNVYVTGWFRAPFITAGSYTIYNQDASGFSSDMFLIKYDPDGNVLWAKSAGTDDDDKGRGCAVDPLGNVVVVGYGKGNSFNVEGMSHPTQGSKDGFVLKYDPDGNLLHSRVYGGSSGEEAFGCSVDGSGNVYVCGNFGSSPLNIDTLSVANPGSSFGAVLLKFDPSLNAVWARVGSSNESDEARGCSTDMYGNTAVTGVYTGSNITFGGTTLNNNGGEEIFLVKYDTDGNQLWAKKAGKSRSDGTNDVFMNDAGRIMVAGYFNSSSLTLGNIEFDNSYVGIATSDVFVATTCAAETGTHNVSSCGPFTWSDGQTYNQSGTAMRTFSNGNACDSLVTLSLTVNTVDVGIIEAVPVLTATATNAEYQWLDCNQDMAPIFNEIHHSFTAPFGSFAVEVTQNGCVDTSNCVQVLSVGVANVEQDPQLQIFPNPTDGTFQLRFTAPLESTVNMEIHDLQGRMLMRQQWPALSEPKTIDAGHFTSGYYLLSVTVNGHRTVSRLVVR